MTLALSYHEPLIQELNLPELKAFQVRLLVRREDRNHPTVSGNKWWKLKYNLLHAMETKYDTIVTFGGAYSNHIYSTAAACHELGLKSIGIIRGEEIKPLNETLAFAHSMGMQFEFISREAYRKKTEPDFLKSLENKFGQCFIIPEGGTNPLAVKGCEELGNVLLKTEFDYLCLPVGTGGTMAGLVNAFDGKRKIIGVPVLKGGGFLEDEIKLFLKSDFTNWQLNADYHFGGYAKTTNALNDFIVKMKEENIPLEFVYSGKLLWAVIDLVKQEFFEECSTVLILHTGGLR